MSVAVSASAAAVDDDKKEDCEREIFVSVC
jgi:hypothetical protein